MLINNWPVLFRPKIRECPPDQQVFTARYYHEIFNLTCAPDLMKTGLYKNAKEWTESAAAFNAVERYLPWGMDKEHILISFGDGGRPRTAALFAFRTKWDCYSVDPALRDEDWSHVQRLTIFKGKAEDFRLDCRGLNVIALYVHSHVPVYKSLPGLTNHGTLSVVAMPCCFALDTNLPPADHEYYDAGIESEKRRVQVWKALMT